MTRGLNILVSDQGSDLKIILAKICENNRLKLVIPNLMKYFEVK